MTMRSLKPLSTMSFIPAFVAFQASAQFCQLVKTAALDCGERKAKRAAAYQRVAHPVGNTGYTSSEVSKKTPGNVPSLFTGFHHG